MSSISEEIKAIETEVNECFSHDSSIDPKKIKRLIDLRQLRLEELVKTHEQRIAVMQTHTRTLTSKMSGLKSRGNAEIIEKIHAEADKFDLAAVHWVNSETCIWEQSEAASIAAGILILVNEIC